MKLYTDMHSREKWFSTCDVRKWIHCCRSSIFLEVQFQKLFWPGQRKSLVLLFSLHFHFSDALRQVKRQHWKAKIWNWGPKTICHNIASVHFILLLNSSKSVTDNPEVFGFDFKSIFQNSYFSIFKRGGLKKSFDQDIFANWIHIWTCFGMSMKGLDEFA